jgi:hypothetical protein
MKDLARARCEMVAEQAMECLSLLFSMEMEV